MRITGPLLRILAHFDAGPVCGIDIIRRTGMKSGTIYPCLWRMEKRKWITGEWETGVPGELDRPLRKIYSLTALGFRQYERAKEQLLISSQQP